MNYWAIIAAAASNMVIGGLWYGPLFGKSWLRLIGATPEQLDAAKQKGMAKTYLAAFVGALVMASVMSWLVTSLGSNKLGQGILNGTAVWLGFVATVLLGGYLWSPARKSWSLYLLDSSYYLVTLAVMGAILATWR